MASDPAVAARIEALKAQWGTTTGAFGYPGLVQMFIPVDTTSCTPIWVPGRVIHYCGFTKDETGNKFGKIYEPAETTKEPTTSQIAVRKKSTKGKRKTKKKVSFRRIYINLKTPVSYSINSTKVEKNRLLTQVSIRVPTIVSIDCINWWLYNESSADKRPLTFETNLTVYSVNNIPQTDLGELPDTAETPEAQQAETGAGATIAAK